MLSDPPSVSTNSVFSGVIGGVQGGYNFRLPSGLVLGVEADLTFPNYFSSNSIVSTLTRRALRSRREMGLCRHRARPRRLCQRTLALLRHRRLRLCRRTLHQHARVGPDQKHINVRPGWAAGAGLEYAFAPHWSVRLEYLYSQFDRANVRFPSGAEHSSTLDFQQVRIGLNRKVDWPGSKSWTPKTDLTDPESDRWEIHGQTTYLGQGYPAFRAPYTGTNSLTPAPQAQATWSNSLYLNARLWEGGEVYYNPELLQGFGLNDTVGAAGFPNGEAQKSNFPYPHYNTSRLFVRQTFGLAASRRSLPADSSSSRARSTSTADAAGRQVLGGSMSLTAIPTPRTPARIS